MKGDKWYRIFNNWKWLFRGRFSLVEWIRRKWSVLH